MPWGRSVDLALEAGRDVYTTTCCGEAERDDAGVYGRESNTFSVPFEDAKSTSRCVSSANLASRMCAVGKVRVATWCESRSLGREVMLGVCERR